MTLLQTHAWRRETNQETILNLEIAEIFDGLINPYLVVILEVSVTLYHA